MKTHNQGDLFILELVSIINLEGELAGDEVTIRICNLAVDQTVFCQIVEETFLDEKIEKNSGSIKVTMTLNGEHLRDGDNDGTDVETFLAQVAARILGGLKATPGWGQSSVADKRLPYDTLD